MMYKNLARLNHIMVLKFTLVHFRSNIVCGLYDLDMTQFTGTTQNVLVSESSGLSTDCIMYRDVI